MNRHDADAVSLAAGVIFLSIAAWWLLGRVVDLDSAAAGWFAAAALLILGLAGLAGALRGDRDQVRPHRH
jgi:hypothetical protein